MIVSLASSESGDPLPPTANGNLIGGSFQAAMQEVSQRSAGDNRPPKFRLNSPGINDQAKPEGMRVKKAERRFDSQSPSPAEVAQPNGSNRGNPNTACTEQIQKPPSAEQARRNTPDEQETLQLATAGLQGTRDSVSSEPAGFGNPLQEISASSSVTEDAAGTKSPDGLGVLGPAVRHPEDLAIPCDRIPESMPQRPMAEQPALTSDSGKLEGSTSGSWDGGPPSPLASATRAPEDLRTNDQARPTPFNRAIRLSSGPEREESTQSAQRLDLVQGPATSPDAISTQFVPSDALQAIGTISVNPTLVSAAAQTNESAIRLQSFPAIDDVVNTRGESYGPGFKDAIRSGSRTTREEKFGHAEVHTDKLRDRLDPDSLSGGTAPGEGGAACLNSAKGEVRGVSTKVGAAFETSGPPRSADRQQSAPDSETSSGRSTSDQQLADGTLETAVPDTALPAGLISNAQLIERLKESEINLNVRSVDFGTVSIRTAMSHDHLSAQISLENHDLGKTLSNAAEALQSKLSQEHGIRATIEVQQQTSSFAGNSGQSQNFVPRSQQHTASSGLPVQETESMPVALAATQDGRLDIRI